MTIYIPLLVGLIGLLLYALSSNGKVQELGKIAYFCGLLVTLAQVAGSSVSLLGK